LIKTFLETFRTLTLVGVYFSATLLLASPAQAQSAYRDHGATGPSARIGGVVLVKPKYEGSDEHEVVGAPFIIPDFSSHDADSGLSQFGKRLSFKSIDDIRFRAFEWKNIELGPIAGYRGGRDESDGDRLGGLGDIDAGLVVGGYVGVRLGSVLLDASASTQVSGDDSGVIVRAGAEVSHDVTPQLRLTTRVGTTFADEEYAETFFGITQNQAGRSTVGLGTYDAGAGLKDVHLDLNARIDLSETWRLQLGARYARLVGDAADSPIVETEDQFSGRLSLGYKFDFSRLH